MKTRNGYSINIGSTSLVMIFAVICLTVFAVMSYLTAARESELAKKYAAHTTAYYAADSRAVNTLASLDKTLSSPEACCGDINGRKTFIAQQCAAQNVTFQEQNGKIYLLYSEIIDTTQSLQVIIQLDLSSTTASYKVVEWKSVYTQEYNIDHSLNVYR